MFKFNVGKAFPAIDAPGRDVTAVTIGWISAKDYLEHIDPLHATGLEVNDFIRLYDADTGRPLTAEPKADGVITVKELRVNPSRKALPKGGFEKQHTLFLSALVDVKNLEYEDETDELEDGFDEEDVDADLSPAPQIRRRRR